MGFVPPFHLFVPCAGTEFENAVVREIHPDRVLFVIDGKSVVVPVSARR